MGGSVDGASGGAGGDGRDDAPIRHVTTATGSIYETGRLAQDRRLYVYEDDEFLAIPPVRRSSVRPLRGRRRPRRPGRAILGPPEDTGQMYSLIAQRI